MNRSPQQLGSMLALLLCLPLAAPAQRATGTISGQVVTEDGQPLPRARIAITGAGSSLTQKMTGRLAVITDAEGKFQADKLDPGAYQINVSAPGYVASPNAERRYYFLGDTPTLTLVKGGVITGKVVNAAGEPVVGVQVQAMPVKGGAASAIAALGLNMSGQQQAARPTDDRGVYRLYGLAPGKYVVAAGGSGMALTPTPFVGRAQTFHPSASRDTAVELTVGSGTELSGIDIRYRGERGAGISGKVTGMPAGGGAPLSGVTIVMLKHATANSVQASTIVVPVGGQNGYALHGVPNGEYEITAGYTSLGEANVLASAPRRLTVSGADLTGIDLALTPLASISGKVVLEKASPLLTEAAAKCASPRETQLDELVLSPQRDEPNAKPETSLSLFGEGAYGVPNAQGVFTLQGLTAGRYRLAAQLAEESWYLKGLALPAGNAADPARNGLLLKTGEKLSGLTVTLGVGAASLQGRVQAVGKLPARLRVHLLPAEAEAKDDVLRFAETLADVTGAFRFEHVAPGKYLVVARAVPEGEAPDAPMRQVGWDVAERAKLRKEAEVVNAVVELKVCQRVADFVLRWK